MSLRYTFTRTYEAVDFADPFLVCGQCGKSVTGWLPDAGRTGLLLPCEHDAGVVSTCPSWGPVDGCQCQTFLGYTPHPPLDRPDPDLAGDFGAEWKDGEPPQGES